MRVTPSFRPSLTALESRLAPSSLYPDLPGTIAGTAPIPAAYDPRSGILAVGESAPPVPEPDVFLLHPTLSDDSTVLAADVASTPIPPSTLTGAGLAGISGGVTGAITTP